MPFEIVKNIYIYIDSFQKNSVSRELDFASSHEHISVI